MFHYKFYFYIFQLYISITPVMAVKNEKEKWLVQKNGEYMHLAHQDFIEATKQGGQSLHEIFVQSVIDQTDKEFLGTINTTTDTIKYTTYGDVYHKVRVFAYYLKGLGLGKRDIIGIFAPNSEEWFVSEQSIFKIDGVSCPLYSTLGRDSLVHIVEQTEMETIFATPDKIPSLIEVILDSKDCKIKRIISFSDVDSKIQEKLKSENIELVFYEEILETSKVKKLTTVEIKNMNLADLITNPILSDNENNPENEKNNKNEEHELDGVVTICYTSGTSGKPKGALLTNSNFVALVGGFSNGPNNSPILEVDSSMIYVSYLPLAHVMEKIIFYVVISVGGKIGFWSGIRERLKLDMSIIKPKMFPGVPRVFERIRDGIHEEVDKKGVFARFIFDLAVKYKIWRQKHSTVEEYLSSTFVDYLIFKKIREQFGGDFSFAISGAAPLNMKVAEFFCAVFSIKIYQGYGQTEALGANLLQTPYEATQGSVGIPFPSLIAKLVENEDGQKELCLKGQAVFKGYFKDPEKTAETIKDGWLYTGDAAEMRNGEFFITGRIKENFKLSIGEFVNPSKLESKFSIPQLDELLILENHSSKFLFAVGFTTKMNVDETELREKFFDNVHKVLKQREVMKFEVPKYLVIVKDKEGLTPENDMLTPTGKKRKKFIIKKFRDKFEHVYQQDE